MRLVANDVLVSSVVKLCIVRSEDMLTPGQDTNTWVVVVVAVRLHCVKERRVARVILVEKK